MVLVVAVKFRQVCCHRLLASLPPGRRLPAVQYIATSFGVGFP